MKISRTVLGLCVAAAVLDPSRAVSEETKLPDSQAASQWHLLGKTEWASIDVEKTLYEKAGEPGFFVHVRVKNLTDRPIGVDLRGRRQWEAVYPKMWMKLETDHRGRIREVRMVHVALDQSASAKLMADFAAGKLTAIPPGKSIDYYRSFAVSTGDRASVDKAQGKYVIVSLDGEQLLTDGAKVEQFSLEWKNGMGIDRTDLVIPSPAPWKTIPAEGRIVPQSDSAGAQGGTSSVPSADAVDPAKISLSHASLKWYAKAVISLKDPKTENLFYVESNGRRLVAFRKDGTVMWSVDVLDATKVTPKGGNPVIRDLRLDQGRLFVTFGKHDYAEVQTDTGATQYFGSD